MTQPLGKPPVPSVAPSLWQGVLGGATVGVVACLVVQPAVWHNFSLDTLSIQSNLPTSKVPPVPVSGHTVVLDANGSGGAPAVDPGSPGGGPAFGMLAGGVPAGGCGGML